MNIFTPRFSARSVLTLSALLAPLAATSVAATADEGMSIIVVSPNPAAVVAAVEPVTIDRSGMAVSRVDLQGTGGLSEELTLETVASSKRPAQREVAQLVDESLLVPRNFGIGHSVPVREDNAASAGGFDTLNRTVAQPRNRQLPSAAPVRQPSGAPSGAGPTYLLGVFR